MKLKRVKSAVVAKTLSKKDRMARVPKSVPRVRFLAARQKLMSDPCDYGEEFGKSW